MKYRSRTDIVASMLQIAQGGAIKTRIMYRAFLSFPQLNEYLELMTDSGLLEYSEEERKYHTSEKGRYFLKMYKDIGQSIAPKESKTAVRHGHPRAA
ncbi:MAG TPA: winged helix-turn-helix domain-containing protein [Nitrososphaera sp.]